MNLKTPALLFILLLGHFCVNAQYLFGLDKYTSNIKNTDFEIVSVKYQNQIRTFGEVFSTERNKQKIGFNEIISSTIENYYKHYNSGIKKVKVGVVIKNFTLSETITNGGQVNGKIIYDIEAYFINAKDTTKFANSRNSATYNRTLQANMLVNVEKQVVETIDNGLKYIIGYIKNSKSNLEAFAIDSKVIIKPFHVKPTIDTVYYQQRKVTWSDFNGPVRGGNNYGAAIFTSFGFDTKLTVENNIVSAEITPKVYTDKNMSWAKPEIKTTYALAHEQLHFDICYLNTLRFLQKIKTLKEVTKDDLLSRIQYEYLEFYRITHTMQSNYDEETNHSLIKNKQQQWEEKIRREIKEIDLHKIIN